MQEEAYLAQTIFLGEMGRYARDWGELERVANFKFQGKGSDAVSSGGQWGDTEALGSRGLSSSQKPLEIEPLHSDETRE